MAIKVNQNMLGLAIKEHGNGKGSVLAKKMGVHKSYISKIRKHDKPVGGKFMKELMDITGFSFSTLFYYEEKGGKIK